MIATWMLYSVLCAAGLSVAAMVAERVLLASGAGVRQAWITAIVCALVIPAVAYRLAPRPVIDAPVRSMSGVDTQPLDTDNATPAVSVLSTSPVRSGVSLRATALSIVGANRLFAVLWITLSSALALYFVAGVIMLAWMRRRWERRTILGVPVLVSERTGPAVVGALSPAIVMPEWAFNMKESQLVLMLRHEQEHRRAGDAQLLTAAHLALILMPWNPGVWWMVMRLGLAVELDCDARVLRSADARSYGDLLLEVARPRRGPRLIGATAFAERAGQLERRIRAIARRRDVVSRQGRVAAVLIGVAAITVACVAPHPAVPARVANQLRTVHAVTVPVSNTAPIPRDTLLNVTGRVSADTIIIASRPAVPARHAFEERVVQTETPLVDSAFARLFSGIALTTEQATQARDLISKLALVQDENNKAATAALVKSTIARIALQANRDSALRELTMTDGDRLTLDARLATSGPSVGGRGGRSGSPMAVGDAFVGGGQGVGGGRGRGRSGGSGVTEVPVNAGDAIYGYLFQGITLSTDEESLARKIIVDAQEAMQALMPEPPLTELRLLASGLVVMRPESWSAFTSLVPNDADRALLEGRIVVEQRVVRRNPGEPRP